MFIKQKLRDYLLAFVQTSFWDFNTRMAFLQGIASLKKTYLLKIQNLLLGISLIQGELTYLFFTVPFIKITSLKLTLQ